MDNKEQAPPGKRGENVLEAIKDKQRQLKAASRRRFRLLYEAEMMSVDEERRIADTRQSIIPLLPLYPYGSSWRSGI